MGRTASGVQGFNTDGGTVIGVALSHEGDTVLVVSENGYGKRSQFDDFRLTSRGKKGVRALHITEKTGSLVSLQAVKGDEDALIVSSTGIMIRLRLADIGVYGRNTQGLKLISLNDGAKVTKVTLVNGDEEEVEEIDIVKDGEGMVERLDVESNDEQEMNVFEENLTE